ncbi:hypothetical protein, partial [Brachybacterium alimentarium]
NDSTRSGFDDFLGRMNDTWGEKPRETDAPVKWKYCTEHTDVKKKAKVWQRISAKGSEYVEETKNPMFGLRPPLALAFRGQKQPRQVAAKSDVIESVRRTTPGLSGHRARVPL